MTVIKSTEHLSFNYIRYAVVHGTTLEEACKEALSLAEEMDLPIEFLFDGLLIRIDKKDSLKEKIEFYNNAVHNIDN